MLVLTRKNGQKIMIGDDIELIVIESNNNSVKLGINAPKNVSVYREEVYKEIKNLNNVSHLASFNELNKLEDLLVSQKSETLNKKLNFVSAKVKIDE